MEIVLIARMIRNGFEFTKTYQVEYSSDPDKMQELYENFADEAVIASNLRSEYKQPIRVGEVKIYRMLVGLSANIVKVEVASFNELEAPLKKLGKHEYYFELSKLLNRDVPDEFHWLVKELVAGEHAANPDTDYGTLLSYAANKSTEIGEAIYNYIERNASVLRHRFNYNK